jgi:hypothetical protein
MKHGFLRSKNSELHSKKSTLGFSVSIKNYFRLFIALISSFLFIENKKGAVSVDTDVRPFFGSAVSG